MEGGGVAPSAADTDMGLLNNNFGGDVSDVYADIFQMRQRKTLKTTKQRRRRQSAATAQVA